jgi:hypothetical protein
MAPGRVKHGMERAMGFEPTTASLEGWNSTTELRPPSSIRPSTSIRLTHIVHDAD